MLILSLANDIGNFFLNIFGNPYVTGFIVSMLPLVELRGGLPLIYFWLGGELKNLFLSSLVAFLGSSIICPLLLLLFIPVINWMKKTKCFKKLAEKIENHFKKKSVKLDEKTKEGTLEQTEKPGDNVYIMKDESVETEQVSPEKSKKSEWAKYFGLFVFTAIPLPLTGVWTASAVAALLNLDFKKSMFFIILGNLVATVAISIVCAVTGIFI